ncbi:hypothetical protein [uncultured Succiniclasticum sp.]|uniref:baseplate complex protein n=1 Tax=uncultured Succiniclasticum sp. TaxID=1500547 RepID=UPI0025D59CD1|nr:hypothetical protein [uncultured Succiniclasticum sp.]
MRIELVDEDNMIKLDDTLLPGIVQGVEVEQKVKYDEKQVSGSSGKKKQVQGFEDSVVRVTVILQNDEETEPYDRLEQLVALFRSMDKEAKPQIYQITNRLCAAYGIGKVLFEGVRVKDDNKWDYLVAELDFVEWEPAVVKVEERAVRGKIKDRGDANAAVKEQLTKFQLADQSLDKLSTPSVETAKVEMPASPAVDDDGI